MGNKKRRGKFGAKEEVKRVRTRGLIAGGDLGILIILLAVHHGEVEGGHASDGVEPILWDMNWLTKIGDG